MSTPKTKRRRGGYGLFAVAAWIFSYYYVPETKGRTLEEIENFWRAAS